MKYQIHDIIFDTQEKALFHNEESVLLEAKSYHLLLAFIQSDEPVLSRDKLIELAWPQQVVSDGAVNKAISKLRNHLEQLSPDVEFILTKPKFGYQFCAPVKIVPEPNSTLGPARVKPSLNLQNRWLIIVISTVLLVSLFFLYIDSTMQSTLEKTRQTEFSQFRFTALEGVETKLSSAKDGKVLFINTDLNGQASLYLKVNKNIPKVLPINLTDVRDIRLAPNGKIIGLVSQNGESCLIEQVSLASFDKKTLFNCSQFSDVKIAWHYDMQRLFIQARKNNATPYKIYQFKIATQVLEQISLPQKHAALNGDFRLATHPSQPRVAFARYLESDRSEIHVLNTHTLEKLATYPVPYVVGALAWDVESDVLFFSADKTLLQIDTQSGSEHVTKQLSYPVESIASTFSSNGKVLLATQYHPSSRIKKYNFNTQNTQTMLNNAALNRLPRQTDNQSLLFLSDMMGTHDLWQMRGEALHKISLPFEFGFRRFQIDNQAEHVLFEKQGALYELSLQTNEVNKLISAEHKAYVANYSQDNKNIIYSSQKSGQWQLWLFNKATFTHSQLTQYGGYSGYQYQGGLIYSKRNQAGLWRLFEGEETLLLKDFSNINWLNFQLIEDNVYFYRKGSGIWRYNLTSKEDEKIMVSNQHFINQFHVNSAQNAILFTELKPIQGDVQGLLIQDMH